MVAVLQGLSAWVITARELSIVDHDIDSFAPRIFFSTLTNVNFDTLRIIGYIKDAIYLRESLANRCRLANSAINVNHPMAALQLAGEDMHGLRMLCLYDLKGAAAYMEHTHVLGQIFNEKFGMLPITTVEQD